MMSAGMLAPRKLWHRVFKPHHKTMLMTSGTSAANESPRNGGTESGILMVTW